MKIFRLWLLVAALVSVQQTVWGQQFALEHTYSKPITRIKLINGEEKYCQYDYPLTSKEVNIYNANHTLRKTITLSPPEGYSPLTIQSITQTTINSDTLLEIMYHCLDSAYIGTSSILKYRLIIANENGDSLFETAGINSKIDTTDGLAAKLFVYSSSVLAPTATVYDLPSLNYEAQYNNYYIKRKKLNLFGEKYFTNDYSTAIPTALIYNADHSLWKTITLVPPNNSYTINPWTFTISDNEFNADSLIEIACAYTNTTTNINGAKIANELGATLWSYDYGQIPITIKDGATQKIMTLGYNASTGEYTNSHFYNLSDFMFDHLIQGIVKPIYSPNVGLKYSVFNSTAKKITFYNPSDYSIWKNVNLPVPAGQYLNYGTGFEPKVNIGVLNSSNNAEILYSYYNNNTYIHTIRIINDNGVELFKTDSTYFASISNENSLTTKILTSGNAKYQVFGIDTTLTTTKSSISLSDKIDLYPSPAQTYLTLSNPENIALQSLKVMSATGATIQALVPTSTKINVSHLPTGTYFLVGQTTKGQVIRKTFIKE
ncbi:Por secretion system C-terminal sorting domain-containing protein [Flexibacter flexilis DSM 6793]|uniref:Por secretion system C-terminal sorting domain-containing protein n=1 Tax=Flexibacter flexilis DSM 6793 TaxID=927664 RepID=A0A1I1LBL2_9BACT|nr:T9SS type A sorting domain-containing protein [Flexibacter flexilis]SFC68388.1 Por secretion system C-terminal sorting domain-containing protein [Flexibacter flexilis DSM 6793]